MQPSMLMLIIAIFTSLGLALGLMLLLYIVHRYDQRLRILEAQYSRIIDWNKRVSYALAKALESSEADEVLRRLRRKARRRYIVFVVLSEEKYSPETLSKAIEEKVKELGGLLGAAEANVQLVYYDLKRDVGILRTNYHAKHLVLAALSLVRRIGSNRVMVIPLATTGTIKRAKVIASQIPS
ncbi:MAG: Rpp14/Pop5 family protein [Pyrodictiaceae archaeon]